MKKYFFLLFSLIFLDLFIKYLAINFLPQGGIYLFKDWLGLELYYNKFIAFSIPLPFVLLLVLNILIIAFLFYVFYQKQAKKTYLWNYQLWAMVLLLAGALANFTDRLYNGYVIDYIVVGKFPVFNLADIMVVLGTLFWLILEYFDERHMKGSRSSTDRTIPS